MNTNKKIRRFCCSTCGIEGHNKNNTKFHAAVPVLMKVENLYTEWYIECDEVVEGDCAGIFYCYDNEPDAIKYYKEVIRNSVLKTAGKSHFIVVRLMKLTTICTPDGGSDDEGKVVEKVVEAYWKKGQKSTPINSHQTSA